MEDKKAWLGAVARGAAMAAPGLVPSLSDYSGKEHNFVDTLGEFGNPVALGISSIRHGAGIVNRQIQKPQAPQPPAPQAVQTAAVPSLQKKAFLGAALRGAAQVGKRLIPSLGGAAKAAPKVIPEQYAGMAQSSSGALASNAPGFMERHNGKLMLGLMAAGTAPVFMGGGGGGGGMPQPEQIKQAYGDFMGESAAYGRDNAGNAMPRPPMKPPLTLREEANMAASGVPVGRVSPRLLAGNMLGMGAVGAGVGALMGDTRRGATTGVGAAVGSNLGHAAGDALGSFAGRAGGGRNYALMRLAGGVVGSVGGLVAGGYAGNQLGKHRDPVVAKTAFYFDNDTDYDDGGVIGRYVSGKVNNGAKSIWQKLTRKKTPASAPTPPVKTSAYTKRGSNPFVKGR